jgi:hypothetical protein
MVRPDGCVVALASIGLIFGFDRTGCETATEREHLTAIGADFAVSRVGPCGIRVTAANSRTAAATGAQIHIREILVRRDGISIITESAIPGDSIGSVRLSRILDWNATSSATCALHCAQPARCASSRTSSTPSKSPRA